MNVQRKYMIETVLNLVKNGETIKVLVTSVLQTPAGRMIFGKPKN